MFMMKLAVELPQNFVLGNSSRYSGSQVSQTFSSPLMLTLFHFQAETRTTSRPSARIKLTEKICYRESESQHVAHYLNRPDVRTMLGADDAAGNFTMSSPKVGLDFNLSGDLARSSRPYIAELLQRDVRVLVYFGSYDWICNWVSALAFVAAGQLSDVVVVVAGRWAPFCE